jgi:thymidylate synthase (FAD)
VRFTIDRGISHEFVRHRVMSFSQESTRYCNYSQGKFGREITVIAPCYLVEGSQPYELWRRSCMSDEVEYFTLLNMGLSPQEARAVLPNSTKTELMMTGTIRQWDHFFDLRARQLTGPAHPQAVEVAEPLMQEMVERWPEAFIG